MDISLFELGERGVLITREIYQPYVVSWNGAHIFQLWEEISEPGRFQSVDVRIFEGPVEHVADAIDLATAWMEHFIGSQ